MPSRTCCLSLSSSVCALARSAPDCMHTSASASARGRASLAARSVMVAGGRPSTREALPAAVDQAFVGKITALVRHRLATFDRQTEIEMIELPAPAQIELIQDRVHARAEAAECRVVVAVHGGERTVGAVDDRQADQL